MSKKFQKYQTEIKQMFNWEKILKEVKINDKENGIGEVYLDTVFSLMPSCKIYPPGEFDDYKPCSNCNGTGKSKKVYFCAKCKSMRKKTGEIEPNGNWCSRCAGTEHAFEDCDLCNGLGSQDAYKDQEFWHALIHVANSFGLWVARGEDDHYVVYTGLK
jgi:RecJ-like exonuclease